MTTTRPSKRARYDWGVARAFFVAMEPPRTRAAVAARFGMSEAAVRQHAEREGWDDLAAEADRRAAEKALERANRTREERSAQLLRIYDAAADRVETGIRIDDEGHAVLDLDVVFAKFPELHRLYRLETEQATDHVALAEVQAGLRTSMQTAIETLAVVAGELLSERKAGELVRAFRARFLPAVNAALAIGGGES